MAAPAALRPTAVPAPETGANAPMSADEFLRLKEEGFFGGYRVELLQGLVVFKMPTSTLHTKALARVLHAFGIFTTPERFVATQSTVKLGLHNAPEPDAFVVRGDVTDDDEEIAPEMVLMAVEVGVTTLRSDRTIKARVYAEANIAEFWILNPAGRQLEVRRAPQDGAYREIGIYDESQSVAPLFAAEVAVPVASLLMRPRSRPA